MSYHTPKTRRPSRFAAVATIAVLALTSCVDGDGAPDDITNPILAPQVLLSPAFSLVGPGGGAVQSQAQQDALGEAFDLVNLFHVIVRRLGGAVVIDRRISVTPGQDAYDFNFEVSAGPNEEFTVTLTAIQEKDGEEVALFSAPDIRIKATPPAAAAGGTPPASTPVTMQYSGPGTGATSVELNSAHVVVGPGGTAQLTGTAKAGGVSVEGVPLGWTTSTEGVATVDAGTVRGVADGLTEVIVTTPTGLTARAWVYVVDGVLAYVQDGTLFLRGPASGEPSAQHAADGAPAFGLGGQLFYVFGGAVHTGGSRLVEGDWPSVSPDATKLAIERGGQIFFANTDGSHPTAGPGGSTPVWADDATLLVGGGSIERVRANGEGRAAEVGGAASLPARSGSGDLAYVEGGALRVSGGATLMEGVRGRPTWSANGRWLVVDAGGLMVVPADGSAPGAPLPGLGGASHPAFRPDGAPSAAPAVRITGLDPEAPSPGEDVKILGSGFDWIIPANNAVIWPTRDGTETSAVAAAGPDFVETVIPRAVIEGQMRVETRSSQSVFAIAPMFGAIEINAKTPFEEPVPGVIGVVRGGTPVAEILRGTSDADGKLLLAGLQPGTYTLELIAPNGFKLRDRSGTTRQITLGTNAVVVAVELLSVVARVESVPEKPEVEVGGTQSVTLKAFRQDGTEITRLATSQWLGGLPNLGATGTALSGEIRGVAPSTEVGGSILAVSLNGTVFEIPVTVRGFVQGVITQDPDPPPPSGVEGRNDGTTSSVIEAEPGIGYTINVYEYVDRKVTGAEGVESEPRTPIATAISADGGRYRVRGLLAGSYEVGLDFQNDRNPVPFSQFFTLDNNTPTAQADFLMSRNPVDYLVLSAPNDSIIAALEAELRITVRSFDEDEIELGGRPAAFTSLDPGIATVDPSTGIVTAVENGTARIVVTVEAVTDTIEITVGQKAVSITLLSLDKFEMLEPAPEEGEALVGESEPVFYEALDANGHVIDPGHKMPNWSSTDEAIFTVSAGGVADFLSVGDATLSVEMDGVTDDVFVKVFLLHPGDLFVTASASSGNYMNPTDIAAARIGKVDGNLSVQSTTLTTLAGLESIFEVDGSVLVEHNASLADVIGLQNIQFAGGDVIIWNNDALVTPPPPGPAALQYIGGDLRVIDNTLVTDLDAFGNLEAIEGTLEISDNPSFDDDDLLPSVQWIGGDVWLRDNLTFASTGLLPGLIAPGGSVIVEGGGTVIGFPTIQAIPFELQVGGESYDNNILEYLELPALQCIGFDFYVYGNSVLTEVSVPNLQWLAAGCGGGPGLPDLVSSFRDDVTRRIDQSHRDRLDARFRDERPLRETVREEVEARQAQARNLREERRVRQDENDPRETSVARRLSGLDPSFNTQDFPGTPEQRARIAANQRTRTADATQSQKAEKPERQSADSEPQLTYGSSNLYISNNPLLTTLDFSSLEGLEGYIQFYYNAVLTSVVFPALTHVGGSLDIDYSHFTTISFPALIDVLGNLSIYENYDPLSFSAPLLRYIGYSLYVEYNQALGDFELPALQHVGYDVDVCDNTWNSVLSLPLLESVGDDFYIEYNTGLTSVQVANSSMLDVGYDLEIYDNDGLQTINIPGLQSVYDDLEIEYNPDLMSVDIATTAELSIGYWLEIYENGTPGNPWTLNIPGLVYVYDDIEIEYNDGLTSVTLATGSPAEVDYEVTISYNPDLVSIAAPAIVDIDSDLDVHQNPVLESIDFRDLNRVGDWIWFTENGTPGSFTADFPSLTEVVTDFWFNDNYGMSSITAPQLVSVGRDLWIQTNHELTSIDLSSLEDVGDDFGVYQNNILTTFSAPVLANTGPYVDISYNNSLTGFNLPSLLDVGNAPILANGPQGVASTFGDVWIVDNLALTGFDLSSLMGVGYVYMYGNDAMTTLGTFGPLDVTTELEIHYHDNLQNLNGLGSVTSAYSIDINNNPALADVSGLGSLSSVSYMKLASLGALTTASFPALATATVWLVVVDNPLLASLSFAALTTTGDGGGPHADGRFEVGNLPALTALTTPLLVRVDGPLLVNGTGLGNLGNFSGVTSGVWQLSVDSNPALTDVTGLHNLGNDNGAAPAIANGMWITNNPALCEDDAGDVFSVLDSKNPGSAVLSTVNTSTGNQACGQQDR